MTTTLPSITSKYGSGGSWCTPFFELPKLNDIQYPRSQLRHHLRLPPHPPRLLPTRLHGTPFGEPKLTIENQPLRFVKQPSWSTSFGFRDFGAGRNGLDRKPCIEDVGGKNLGCKQG